MMSIALFARLFCSRCGLEFVTESLNPKRPPLPEARKIAQAAGWKFASDEYRFGPMEVCPDCASKAVGEDRIELFDLK